MGNICGKRSRAPKPSTGGKIDGDPISSAAEETLSLKDSESVERVESQESLESMESVDSLEPVWRGRAETYRLRITPKLYHAKKYSHTRNPNDLYVQELPMRMYVNENTQSYIYHISVFNDEGKKIVDHTFISGGDSSHSIYYCWNADEKKWLRYITNSVGEKLDEPIKKPSLWAIATIFKDNKEHTKVEFLSKKLTTRIPIPFEKVSQTTTYNMDLMKTLEVIVVTGRNNGRGREFFVQWNFPTEHTEHFFAADVD